MKIIRHLTTLGLIFNVTGCGFVDELFGVRDGIPIPPGQVACNTLAECVAKESACHTAVECAADGLCVFEDPSDGTAITQQTVGDCTQVVCDGVGNTKTIPASDDIEDDQNPCTLDECMNGMPVHTPQPQIQVDCYTGPSGTKDIGICKGGIRQCDNQGNLIGSCEGEVVPVTEDCEVGMLDEDCDGQVNEEGLACICNPLAMEPCYTGPVGTEGVGICVGGQKTCNIDGLGYGPCVGEQLPGMENCEAGMVDEDCDGFVNEEGLACICSPSVTEACYTGPAGTQDVGICVGGQKTCAVDGLGYGPCVGEVTPAAELCAAALQDEDCDGQVNEGGMGCVCSPLVTEACYTGPAGTQGVGICVGGQKTCTVDGLGFGPCSGEQLPSVENCEASLLDEDCDGQVNEEGASCFCGDGYTSIGEECDDGNQISTDGCTTLCKLPKCGDGFTQPSVGETCDDGGTQDGDICSPSCKEQKVLAIETGGRFYDMDLSQRSFTCALLSGGIVKCWGRNDVGQLGLGNTNTYGQALGTMGNSLPSVDLGAGKKATAITTGGAHACALLDDGSVKCWGLNDVGQLGQGDKANRGDDPNEMGDQLLAIPLGTGKIATAISAGFTHTCALLNDGSVKCWGRNDLGQLGQGDSNDRGDAPNEMGNALPAVDLGPGVTVNAVSAGGSHTCVLLANGNINCWGANLSGQLGLGNQDIYGNGVKPMGTALPEVNLGVGKTGVAIGAGEQHTCAILNNGALKCWGWNAYGQLGLGDTSNRGDGIIGMMGDGLAAIDLGAGKTVSAVNAGTVHTCALLNDGTLKCWGSIVFGQLGQTGAGDNLIGNQAGDMGNALNPINLGSNQTPVAISAGHYHTCALFANQRAKCWGLNNFGQLGLEDMMDRGLNSAQMGDNLSHIKLFSALW